MAVTYSPRRKPASTPAQAPGETGAAPASNSIADQVRSRISQTNDLAELIRIYRGFYSPQLGGNGNADAQAVANVAGDKIAQMGNIDRNALSTMHDAEITGAVQGQSEKKQYEDQASQQQTTINQFADQYGKSAQDYHTKLAASLQDQNQQIFSLESPNILEDLHRRGLASSASATAQANAQALKELQLESQDKLSQFDTGAFENQQDIMSGGLSNLIGGQQSGLEAALNARRSGLEQAYSTINSQNQDALAKSLAKRKSRDSLYSSLISSAGQAGAAAIKA